MTEPQSEQPEPRSHDLEVMFTKVARALFDYTVAQEDYEDLARLDALLTAFERTANDYHNRTGGLHPDLALELGEWITFKGELLDPDHEQRKREGKSNLDRHFVDSYSKVPETILVDLEHELGLINEP